MFCDKQEVGHCNTNFVDEILNVIKSYKYVGRTSSMNHVLSDYFNHESNRRIPLAIEMVNWIKKRKKFWP